MPTYDLQDAETTWQAWVVTGITLYKQQDFPVNPYPVLLPAMTLRMEARGEGQTQRGFTTPSADNVFFVRGICLVEVGGLARADTYWASAWGLLDAYLAKTAADPTLNSRLSEPMRVLDPVVGPQLWNLTTYIGFTCLHRWVQRNP